MSQPYQPFQPLLNSSAPSFSSSAFGATSHVYALESTATREWQFPSGRTVRLAGSTADRYYVKFGESASVAAASTDSMMLIGNIPQILAVSAKQSHVAFVSSTSIAVNVTLGMGGA